MGNLHHPCAGKICTCFQYICCPRVGHEDWWGYCFLSNHLVVALCVRNDSLADKVQSKLGKCPNDRWKQALRVCFADEVCRGPWFLLRLLFYSNSVGILHQCSAPGAMAPPSRAADLLPWLLPVEPLFSCCGFYVWLTSQCRSIWIYVYMVLTRASHLCVSKCSPREQTDRMNIDIIKNRFIRLASRVWSE